MNTTLNKTEQYVSEFLKCKRSFNYFCKKYIKIELPGGDVALNPYMAQSNLINLINNDHFILVLKSRQIGISTIIQAYSTWLCIFYDNVVIGIISKDGPEATSFARSIAGMIDKLPEWMKPKGGQSGAGFKKRSEQSFILTNGSKCYAATVNPKAPAKTLRGKSITFLIIDEAAFIEYLDEAWTSMIPALSTSQKHAKEFGVPYGILVLSTPNKTVGVGAWFYKKYKDSIGGNNILKPFIIHWKDIQELSKDPSWYKNQCDLFDNDERKIQQELELKFVASAGTFFDEKICEFLQENSIEPIEKIRIFDGEIWKFDEPILGKYYLIGVDTASEFGADKSAITVWDYQTLEEVWEYQGKCEVKDFIKVVKLACSMYQGLCVIERNSYGDQVAKAIRDSKHGIMLYNEKTGKDGKILKPGLGTTAKTRPLMIDSLYTYVTQFPECIKSKRLALELIGLVDKAGKVQADTGSNDDLALSASLAFYVRKYDTPMIIQAPVEFLEDFSTVMKLNPELTSSTEKVTNIQLSHRIIKKIKSGEFEKDSKGNAYFDILEILNKS